MAIDLTLVRAGKWDGVPEGWLSVMYNPETYKARAEECRRKAEMAGDARDKVAWAKLAEGWMLASRIWCEAGLTANQPATGRTLWRGETARGGAA